MDAAAAVGPRRARGYVRLDPEARFGAKKPLINKCSGWGLLCDSLAEFKFSPSRSLISGPSVRP